jgi:hypothetical protein
MHEPEVIEGFGDFLTQFKPVVIIEILTDEIANKLNNLIDLDEHIIFHLKGENMVEKCDKFCFIPNKWNFVFFHKSKKDFIQKYTTLCK